MAKWNGEWWRWKHCQVTRSHPRYCQKARAQCLRSGGSRARCSLCSRCGDSLLADIYASQFFLWNSKRRAGPRGQLRITMYHIRKYKMNLDPEVVSYLLGSYVFSLRKWFYNCKDRFKIHYVSVNDDTQWVRIPWARFLPVMLCVLPAELLRLGSY